MLKTLFTFFWTIIILANSVFEITAQESSEIRIKLQQGEKLWSGAIKEGHKMPFGEGYQFDFYANNQYNQIQPLIISNQGLWVWSEEPYAFKIVNNELIISKAFGEIKQGKSGNTLASARSYASSAFFPASGKMPDELLFSQPQYNTWIELTYNHNQEDILKYARAISITGLLLAC
ncbi:MAG: hypothetical protein HC905_09100 [Bacteroidales bacterium]|nr:hypothetical protein [Bacteroidales bacterium]